MPGDETNISEDWNITRGSTAYYKFRLIPLNAVGASAVMNITGAAFGPFVMSLDNEFMGSNPYVDVSVTIAASTSAGYTPGVYPYQILMTLADGVTVLPCGKGSVVVQ